MYNQNAIIGQIPISTNANFGLSYSLNSASLKFAISFIPTQTITLAKVNFSAASITGSPTCTVRIETDSSGRPSGTLAWGSATATGVSVSSGWQSEIALGATGTLTKGTLYHLVILNDNGSPASNYFSVGDQGGADDSATAGYSYMLAMMNFTSSYNGSTWSTRNAGLFMLVSNDATPIRIGQPFDSSNLFTMGSGTYYGHKFLSRVSGTLGGVLIGHLPNGTPNLVVKLYDVSDTLLGTATWANTESTIVTGRSTFALFFDSASPTLAYGSTYRIVLNDSTGTDRIDYATAPSSPVDYRQVSPFAQDFQWTQGNTGSWTDTPGKFMMLALIMDSL